MTSTELNTLHSFEVPILYYLQQILTELQKAQISAGADKKSELDRPILNIQNLIKNIETKQLETRVTEQNHFKSEIAQGRANTATDHSSPTQTDQLPPASSRV